MHNVKLIVRSVGLLFKLFYWLPGCRSISNLHITDYDTIDLALSIHSFHFFFLLFNPFLGLWAELESIPAGTGWVFLAGPPQGHTLRQTTRHTHTSWPTVILPNSPICRFVSVCGSTAPLTYSNSTQRRSHCSPTHCGTAALITLPLWQQFNVWRNYCS